MIPTGTVETSDLRQRHRRANLSLHFRIAWIYMKRFTRNAILMSGADERFFDAAFSLRLYVSPSLFLTGKTAN